MPIQVQWDDPARRAIHLNLGRDWSWDDLKQAIAQADTLITSVPHTVDLLIDLRGSAVPRDFLSGARDLFAQGEARPNEGQRIVIGASWALRTAYQGLLRVYGAQLAGRPFHFADTPEAARQFVQQQP